MDWVLRRFIRLLGQSMYICVRKKKDIRKSRQGKKSLVTEKIRQFFSKVKIIEERVGQAGRISCSYDHLAITSPFMDLVILNNYVVFNVRLTDDGL